MWQTFLYRYEDVPERSYFHGKQGRSSPVLFIEITFKKSVLLTLFELLVTRICLLYSGNLSDWDSTFSQAHTSFLSISIKACKERVLLELARKENIGVFQKRWAVLRCLGDGLRENIELGMSGYRIHANSHPFRVSLYITWGGAIVLRVSWLSVAMIFKLSSFSSDKLMSVCLHAEGFSRFVNLGCYSFKWINENFLGNCHS